ncbi:MAG: radical SAM protein [Nitrososphaeria archaeon]|nr:radical SAM protein [Nitrososphaeria archaeon]NIQ33426.1 radical SAM protein [Nitrososphaeria archaeon]
MELNQGIILDSTESVCPSCFTKISASIIEKNGRVFIQKLCPFHGSFNSLYWDDVNHYNWCKKFQNSRIPKGIQTTIRNGCPFDCGLCPSHEQHTCLAVIEVTNRCNLFCNYCFASSQLKGQDVDLEIIKSMFKTIEESEEEPRPVQLSGGEPTVRKDLPQIVELGADLGFSHIEVDTNGVLLAKEENMVKMMKDAGLSCFYLQFDGLTSDVYEKLRGVDLLNLKFRAIENCRKHGVPVILVPTVVKGVNDHQLGDIIQFAIENRDVVRGINIQPVSYFGRYVRGERLSLAGVAKRVSDQTGFTSIYDFYPIPCPSLHCSNVTVLIISGKEVTPITRLIDVETYLDGFYDKIKGTAYIDMLVDPGSGVEMAEEIICSCGIQISGAIKKILENSLLITMMGFMDAYTLDLKRLSKCCIHVATPDRRLIPFCSYNMTNTQGEYLHRGKKDHRR